MILLIILLLQENGKYVYRIMKDGKEVHKKNNDRPEVYHNMELFTNGKWYNAANVRVKNLEFKNLSKCLYQIFFHLPLYPF